MVDDFIEELVDGFEVWALDIPVELFEVEGKVDGCSDAWLEDLGLFLWVEVVWEVHWCRLWFGVVLRLNCRRGLRMVFKRVWGCKKDNAVNAALVVVGLKKRAGSPFYRGGLGGEVGRVFNGFDHCSDLEWLFEE